MNARQKIADAGAAFSSELTAAIERMRRQADAQDFLLWAAQTAEDYAAGRCGMPVVTVPDGAQMAGQPPFNPIEDAFEDMPRILKNEPGPPLVPQTPDRGPKPSNAVDFAWADGAQ